MNAVSNTGSDEAVMIFGTLGTLGYGSIFRNAIFWQSSFLDLVWFCLVFGSYDQHFFIGVSTPKPQILYQLFFVLGVDQQFL